MSNIKAIYIETTEEFYCFSGGNKYTRARYTLEEAKLHADTLIGCAGCIDCIRCAYCRGCYKCRKCSDCINCDDCTNCDGCFNLDNAVGFKDNKVKRIKLL